MGTRTWTRLAAAAIVGVVAAVALFGLAAPAPANNREPLSELALVAGLSDISAGQPVALSARLVNQQSSTYVNVRYRTSLPAGATFVSTDCPSFQATATEFICNWGHQLRSGRTASVVYVLRTSASSSSFTTSGEWIIKEGSAQSGAPDTFPTNPVAVSLVAADNPNKAGTYATTACSDTSTPTIATYSVLGPGNPLATSVCAPNLPQSVLGLPASVNERDRLPSDPGTSQVSDICMPAPTFSCAPGFTPFKFSSLATFTFTILNASLPAGDEIDTVYHDGAVVSTNRRADPHVVMIKNERFKGITTVVVRSSENGQWTFG